MQKVQTEQITTISAGTLVGLSEQQAARRTHQLRAAGKSAGLEDGFSLFRATEKLTFKMGEEFYTEEGLPKSIVHGLRVLGEESGEAIVDADSDEIEPEPEADADETDQPDPDLGAGDDSDDQVDPDLDSDAGSETEEVDLESLTVPKIKAKLDNLEVDYKGLTKKSELLALLKESLTSDSE